jgi:hypothetical protein
MTAIMGWQGAGSARSTEQALGSFVDARSSLRVEVHRPGAGSSRWREYLAGAEDRYRAHDILGALDRPGLEDGGSATLVFVVLDVAGRVVAGVRGHGPLRSTTAAAALGELGAHARLGHLEDLVGERLEHGLVEIKGAWVSPHLRRAGVSAALARCHVHAMTWFGARYAMCTSSVQTAPRWESSGGRAMAGFEPVHYPDERYDTVLLWWTRELVESQASPRQWELMVAEAAELGCGPRVVPVGSRST